MKTFTFKTGGIHPEENKLSADKAIVTPEPVKQYFVPVTQHLGAPAKVLVARGDQVRTGQLLARGEAFISANIHSPATGKVSKIDVHPDQSGYRRTMIFIEAEETEVWEDGIDTTPDIKREITSSREEIIEKIKEKGIVGLGGATFPTHIKLMIPSGRKVETLLINGVECEPYLTADHRVMLERAEEMLIGIQILMKGLGVDKAFIGIEKNKPDAIAHLDQLCQKFPGIAVAPLKVKYPQGAEKQLIKAVLNREVPSGKLPLDVGCVVSNAGTALAVYEAVQKNKPLIERVVTVTGKKVKSPCNLQVRIGTPIQQLIEYAGGLPEDTGKVISGGPMMGKALNSLEAPVTKGTSGILIMQQGESLRKDVQNCIRCAKCTTVCPMGLEPYLLAQEAKLEKWDMAEKDNVMDCIECGSCLWECPSGRPLLDYIRVGKSKVGNIIRTRKN
ncbi:MAG: electron transport complex subunit RsxC [Bacteroidales bacterium]